MLPSDGARLRILPQGASPSSTTFTLPLSTASTILSSVSNVLLTIGIANVSSADEVGRFSIAVLLFLFLLAASRAVTGQVLLLRPGCGELEALALGTALLIGGLASVAGAIVAISTGGPLSPAIAWPILFLPALLLQDTYRFIAFGRSRPGLAAAGDLAWATATGAGLLLVRFDLLGPGGLVMVWTLAGVASAALLAAATSVRPDLSGALRRPQWDRTLQLWLLAEAVCWHCRRSLPPSSWAPSQASRRSAPFACSKCSSDRSC